MAEYFPIMLLGGISFHRDSEKLSIFVKSIIDLLDVK